MNRATCHLCHGARLKPEILAVTIKDTSGRELNIHQFCELTIAAAAQFVRQIDLPETQRAIVSEVLHEISSRLEFLLEVGLEYLTLNRESGTLSGGEAQRIRLATQIGAGLAGVLYVLDEPSIGLHQRDNARLIGTLRRLRDLGNSVIVVEHDEETIRAADHILDLGPGAGPRGGEIVAEGTLAEILDAKNSPTAAYLSGRSRISIPRQRVAPRPPNESSDGWITIVDATENNLKKLTVGFPLGCFTCITGVSGSGKSTSSTTFCGARSSAISTTRKTNRARIAASTDSTRSTRRSSSTKARSAARRARIQSPTPAPSRRFAISSASCRRRGFAATARGVSAST